MEYSITYLDGALILLYALIALGPHTPPIVDRRVAGSSSRLTQTRPTDHLQLLA